MSRLDQSLLDEALEFAPPAMRHAVADALACHLHNDGYTLEGNTEGSDIEWFARRLYEWQPSEPRWDRASEDEKRAHREIARRVMVSLPDYQLRVANRLITLSRVVRDIERASRPERKR